MEEEEKTVSQKEIAQDIPDQQIEDNLDNWILVRNYKKCNDETHFYHIYTGSKITNEILGAKISTKLVPLFKDYLKEDQKEEFKIGDHSKNLVLIPKYCKDLKQGEYWLPKVLTPVFEEGGENYELSISKFTEQKKDIEDLTYFLICQFHLAELESLSMQEGESQKIMKIIITEIFENYLYDCYSSNNSTVILNSGITLKFSRKKLSALLRRVLIKWRDIESSVYHSDQFVSIWQKLLQILGTSEHDFSQSYDDVEDSELFDSLIRHKTRQLNEENDWLYINLNLAAKNDRGKVQEFKIIKGMDEIYGKGNVQVEFMMAKDIKQLGDMKIEKGLFKKLYKEEVIEQVTQHYRDMLDSKLWEKNYAMIYGQKGTGKTFFVRYILPQIFYDIDFEYIDMNLMIMLNSDLIKWMKYLSSFFLYTSTAKKKIYVIDHLDWALPKADSNEMLAATKRIKLNQMLTFFLQLIDGKKYTLLFVGRHYQNIDSELAGVSRIDQFIQVNPPDYKKRVQAFEHIINSSYELHIAKFVSSSKEIDLEITKPKLMNTIWNQLAAKTEHYKFSNLIQVSKAFIRALINKSSLRQSSDEGE